MITSILSFVLLERVPFNLSYKGYTVFFLVISSHFSCIAVMLCDDIYLIIFTAGMITEFLPSNSD